MKHLIVLYLLLLLALSGSCIAQDRPFPNSDDNTKAQAYVNPDNVEVIRDLYALQCQKIRLTEKQTWVLAQATPSSKLVQGTEHYEQSNVPTNVSIHGDLHILFTLTGSVDSSHEEYSWDLPFAIWDVAGYVKRKDAFANSAFSRGGFVICRINKFAEGKPIKGYERYDPAYIFPSEYQHYLSPALKFTSAHPSLLDEDKPNNKTLAQKDQMLYDLIHNSNPLLAASAFQVLVATAPLGK